MKKLFQSKLFLVSLFFLSLGITFLLLEKTFYQYIDTNGFLQESWFMPLGFLSLLLGCIILVYIILKKIWSFVKNLRIS